MTYKHRLGWLARISFAGLLSMGLIACSDDDGDGNDDVDAAPVDIDAPPPCEGHNCEPDGVVALPEGGTLRVEYLHSGNDEVTGDRIELPMRAFMLQFEGQDSWDGDADTPRPFLGPPIANTDSITCYDQTSYNLFFNAHHPNNQAFADSRTYYADGPDTITMTNDAGDLPVDLIRSPDTADPAEAIVHDYIYLGSGPATELARGQKYSIDAQGPDGTYPGFVAESGYDVPVGATAFDGTIGAYVAPDFTLDMPSEQEFYNNLQIDSTQDLAMGFTMLDGATIPADWPEPIWFAGFVGLYDYNGNTRPTLDYLCLGPAGRDNSNANLAVPQAVFDEANFPQAGKFITGFITHTAWAMNETQRFDAVAMNCDIGDFTLVTP